MEENIQRFLDDLAELTKKYNIAISGGIEGAFLFKPAPSPGNWYSKYSKCEKVYEGIIVWVHEPGKYIIEECY